MQNKKLKSGQKPKKSGQKPSFGFQKWAEKWAKITLSV